MAYQTTENADGTWAVFNTADERTLVTIPTKGAAISICSMLDRSESKLAEIAKRHMGFDTLETRNSDDLDFRDVAVWAIKSALVEAFLAGKV